MKDSLASYSECIETQFERHFPTIKVAFLDVGQGDTIVISSPDTYEAIVVDCIDSNAVLDYFKQENIKYLRGIVVSHLHDDHYKQVDDLLYRYHQVPGIQECEKLAFVQIINTPNREKLMRDADDHQEQIAGNEQQRQISQKSKVARRIRETTLRNMYDWCLNDKKRFKEPRVEGEIKPLPFSGILAEYVDVLHPYGIDLVRLESVGLNNASVVLHVKNSKCSALLTGDLEPAGWEILQENCSNLKSDVLKFPHHGGAWNVTNTKSLLDVVQPSIVVISVGSDGERYKHPNKDVFETLSSPPYSHIRVLCTQATNQCMPLVLKQKESVIRDLDHLANNNGLERVGSKPGCPCAGSIFIELGENACVVQPTAAFHQKNIIIPHFRSHKCVFA